MLPVIGNTLNTKMSLPGKYVRCRMYKHLGGYSNYHYNNRLIELVFTKRSVQPENSRRIFFHSLECVEMRTKIIL